MFGGVSTENFCVAVLEPEISMFLAAGVESQFEICDHQKVTKTGIPDESAMISWQLVMLM